MNESPRHRHPAQAWVLAATPERVAAALAENEAGAVVAEAERHCREAADHGRQT